MKVSIIVPVYNTSAYLDRCLECLVNQSYKNIEIILVDDGSTDNSRQICTRWAGKDSRIICLNKENGGQSSARNLALDHATGEYICFVDSDDCVSPHYVADLLNMCIENNTNISMCGYNITAENTPGAMPASTDAGYAMELISKYDYFRRIYTVMEIAHVVIWNKIYHRSIFENLRFSEGKIYEDEGITHLLIDRCENISVCFKPLYYYTVRQGSTMTPDKFKVNSFDILRFWQDRMDYFRRNGWHDLVYFTMKNYLVKCLEIYNNINEDTSDGDMYKKHIMSVYKNMLSAMKKNPVKSRKFILRMEYYGLFPQKFAGTDRRQYLFGNQ